MIFSYTHIFICHLTRITTKNMTNENMKICIYYQTMFTKILLLTITIFLLTTAIAQAVGISVAPSKLKIESIAHQVSTSYLAIKNPSSKVAIYDVYSDDLESWISVESSSFILEAGETKKVAISIRPPQPGVFSTNISIVAKPLSTREFQANSGVKIPLQIRALASPQGQSWLTLTTGIYAIDILLGLILVMALITKRKNQRE